MLTKTALVPTDNNNNYNVFKEIFVIFLHTIHTAISSLELLMVCQNQFVIQKH